MSKRAAELGAALVAATDAPAIVDALNAAIAHNEGRTRRTLTPEALAAWLIDGQCSPEAVREANRRLAVLFGAGAAWIADRIDNTPEVWAALPFRRIAPPDAPPDEATTWRIEQSLVLLDGVHAAWRKAVPQPRHPLAPLVDAWQRTAPVPAPWDDRQNPILPGTLAGRDGGLRPLVVANDPRQLPLHLTGGAGEPPRQLWLGFEQPEPDRVPVLPLVAFDARGGPSMTQGRGAAHAIRLYVEALLAVPPELRRVGYGPPANLHARLREVVAGLWPRGWQRGRDWPRLLAGLDELRKLGVEWDHGGAGGVWFAVTVRSVPRDARLDDLVRFEVLLPPGSGPGPMVDRAHLRLLGLDSAPAYRLYLSLCWLWDHYGTVRGRLIGADTPQRSDRRRAPVRPVKVGDVSVNPAALHRYPMLTPDHLAAMAYAPADLAADDDPNRRNQRRRARAALDLVAKVTGAVVIPAPGPVAGTVQVLPPASHKAAHDGKAELWRNVNTRT